MNATFDVVEKRSWIRVRVVALALLLVSAVLVTITLFLSAAPPAIERFRHGYFPEVPIPLWLLTIAFEILAVPVNALLYVILFQYLPSTETGWKPALVGGLTASILWEVAKKGLASWILRANHTIFGDLANVILFLLWIYYSMIIMLIGAEVAAEMSRLHAKCRSNAASKR
jgi:membrane protein